MTHRGSGPGSTRHVAASRRERPPLTRRRAVVERRHCQLAASNDARVCPALRLDKGASARAHRGDHVASDAQVRRVIAPRDVARAQETIAAGQAARRRSKGYMRTMDSGHCNARPLGGTQSDSGSDELKRRVTTATPVRSRMEQGKEPSNRIAVNGTGIWVSRRHRAEDIAHSRCVAGDFVWRLRGSHVNAHGSPHEAHAIGRRWCLSLGRGVPGQYSECVRGHVTAWPRPRPRGGAAPSTRPAGVHVGGVARQ